MGKNTLAGLLAAAQDVAKETASRQGETIRVFKTDAHIGLQSRYEPYTEGDRDIPQLDRKERVTTVPERLRWMSSFFEDALNLTITREVSNTQAKADLVLPDGTKFEDVPVGVLMELPRHLKALRQVVENAPTLDNSRRWEASTSEEHVYEAAPETTIRRIKRIDHKVVVQATDLHPAQVAEVVVNEPVGEVVRLHSSGGLTSVQKARMLRTIDQLLKAVQEARGNANAMTPDRSMNPIGRSILENVFGKDLMATDPLKE